MNTPAQTQGGAPGDAMMFADMVAGCDEGKPLCVDLELSGLERLLLQRNDLVGKMLMRSRRRGLRLWDYEQMVGWAAFMCITRGLSHATVANYLDAVGLLAEWLNARQSGLESVTAGEVEKWLRDLTLVNREKARTRSLKLSAVRQYYAWREMNGDGINPVRSLPGPKREEYAPEKYTTKHLQAMFRSCDVGDPQGLRDLTILMFAHATGARREEIVKLNLQQVTLKTRVGSVLFQGKGSKHRVVGFEGPVVGMLREWMMVRDSLHVVDHDALFVGVGARTRGERLRASGLDRVIDRATIAAKVGGMRCGLHRMRVTFATDMYDAGIDLERIRQLMGHNDINTTRKYISVSNTQLSTRMSSKRQKELLGVDVDELPIWFRQRLQQRGR